VAHRQQHLKRRIQYCAGANPRQQHLKRRIQSDLSGVYKPWGNKWKQNEDNKLLNIFTEQVKSALHFKDTIFSQQYK
jgi:hypothetical protein